MENPAASAETRGSPVSAKEVEVEAEAEVEAEVEQYEESGDAMREAVDRAQMWVVEQLE